MNKIAIIRRNGLGDLLAALPLVAYLKENGNEITLFVGKSNAALLSFMPPLAKTVVLPVKKNKYLSHLLTAFRFRKKFDIAISAKSSPMKLMNLFLYVLAAKKSIAYVDKSWHAKFINCPLYYDVGKAKGLHQALKNLQMVAPHFEDVPEYLYPRLSIPEHLKQKYSRSFPMPALLLNATTTREASRFEEEKYAAIVNALHKKFSFFTVIMGQKKDLLRADKIASYLKGDYVKVFPRNFEEFMVILDCADVYFVPDGGIAHIGAALNKTGVILFGETSPIEWHPLSKKMEVFFHPEHVDHLDNDLIFDALEKKVKKVFCARDNL